MGYDGLVAGVCFAEVGHQVNCVDIDEQKINMLKQGIFPIYEAGLEELMQKNNAAGRLEFTTGYTRAYKDADAIFIGVGTPEQPDGSANLSHIATVARQIAETIEKDCLVVVKSTVPVGTNDKVEQFIHDFLVHDVRVEVASNPEFLAQGTAVRPGDYKKLMRTPLVYDGRNIYGVEEMRQAGVEYYSIGRQAVEYKDIQLGGKLNASCGLYSA